MKIPILRLKKNKEKLIQRGFLWIFSGDIVDSSELAILEAGELVEVRNLRDEFIAIGYYNKSASLACRILTYKKETIDEAFFAERFLTALNRRGLLTKTSYFRAVHAEADYLPGLVVDCFGDLLGVQIGTAGIFRFYDEIISALKKTYAPKGIIIRSDAPKHEGINVALRTIGDIPEMPIAVWQNDVCYYANLIDGQKTGWYFDQRENHALFASYCRGKTVLDVYAHSGGFGLLAAAKGATSVAMIDRSESALHLAKIAAKREVEIIKGEAFTEMEKLIASGQKFDCVVVDPPPFIKNKQDITSGMKGYEKISFLAAKLVNNGGVLMLASCSHHASRGKFFTSIQSGISRAGRKSKIICETSVPPDHPVHPQMPQTEYLKAILLTIY